MGRAHRIAVRWQAVRGHDVMVRIFPSCHARTPLRAPATGLVPVVHELSTNLRPML